MANILPPRPRQMAAQRRTFAVVSSQYNGQYVQALVENFRREMETIAPSVYINAYEVPGSFEIPLVVQEIAALGGVDAIAAFGVVIEGETQHASFIGQAVTQALMDISLRSRIPVIHEVLVLRNEEQARARCLEPQLNRGVEAARAAFRIAQTFSELKGR